MRFHLVDRIDAWETGRSIRARKLTAPTEGYWIPSGAGLVMPEMLILEALCQAGSWLVYLSSGRRRRAALLSMGEVVVHGPVRPGDMLWLEGEVESMGEETAVFSGRVTAAGRLVLEAGEIMCAILDGAMLEAPEETDRMAAALLGEGGRP